MEQPMLRAQVFSDHASVSRHAADWLVERLREKPHALWCLATGATPIQTYQRLAERGAAEPTLVNRLRVVNLDEWGGLAKDDPASCGLSLRTTLVTPLGLGDRYVEFDGLTSDPQAECARVVGWLERHGPIDVCVLGLGMNGHLGFNEPADQLQPHAHVAELTQASLSHAMLRERPARPAYGLTLGMVDVFQSRRVVLLVTGASKQDPLQRLLSGQISTQFPASLLHLHSDVTLLCDKAALP
jgi:galactosamine-6-phosphate isomerase